VQLDHREAKAGGIHRLLCSRHHRARSHHHSRRAAISDVFDRETSTLPRACCGHAKMSNSTQCQRGHGRVISSYRIGHKLCSRASIYDRRLATRNGSRTQRIDHSALPVESRPTIFKISRLHIAV
jgi:hypothetical protein